jgi:hypothetical protein
MILSYRGLAGFLALLCACCVGCSHVARPPLASLLARPDAPLHHSPGQRIVGYTDSTGLEHGFSGFALAKGSDSLAFTFTSSQAPADPTFEMNQRQVSRLHVRRFSWWKTSLLVVPPVVLGIVGYELSRETDWNQ